jgi:hypothetical protein
VQQKDRQTIVPLKPLENPVYHTTNQKSSNCKRPHSTQDSHVAILVVRVRLCVSRRRPSQSSVEDTIFNGCQVGIRLDDHDVLDIQAIGSFCPDAEGDEAVDE